MNAAPDVEPLTAASVLLADDQTRVTEIGAVLAKAGISASSQLNRAVDDEIWGQIKHELTSQAASALRTDLATVLFSGWRDWRLLREAARTSARTGEQSKVPLATHRIESLHTWNVEVCLYGRPLIGVDFVLAADFDIDIANAYLRAGRLVGIDSGHCEVTVRLEVRSDCEPKAAELKKHAVIDLAARISFGNGIPLLGSAEVAGVAS
jgi:hypothetical protein